MKVFMCDYCENVYPLDHPTIVVSAQSDRGMEKMEVCSWECCASVANDMLSGEPEPEEKNPSETTFTLPNVTVR